MNILRQAVWQDLRAYYYPERLGKAYYSSGAAGAGIGQDELPYKPCLAVPPQLSHAGGGWYASYALGM
jgi:hypothetical protein